MRQRGFCAWGIQTGPFAACLDDIVALIFHHHDLYTGESNCLLPQKKGENEKGIHPGGGQPLMQDFQVYNLETSNLK